MDDVDRSRLPVFLAALRAALGRAPLWFLCWLPGLFAAAAVSLPWASWFDEALAHRYEPGSLRASLPTNFRFDHAAPMEALSDSGAKLAAVLALLIMLFGIFSAGGWLQVSLERTSGHSVRRFLWGGGRYFWRFVRVWILTLLLLALITWLCHGWFWDHVVLDLVFGAEGGDLESLTSESSAVWLGWLQAGLYAVLFALVLVWGDYTRTRLALHGTRSALWAGICTFFLLLVHPLRALRPFFFIVLLELLVIQGVGAISWRLSTGLAPESAWQTVLVIFLLGQLAILWQTISRGARYFAAVSVSRDLVPPLAHPDPWAKRIGGPGGPQYPIDDGDEYGVSI